MSTPPSRPSGRPRGGQKGNQNALKHGLYSTGDGRPAPNGIFYLGPDARRGFYDRFFKESELSSLEDRPVLDLKAEIMLLRFFMRRLLAQGNEVKDLAVAIKILRALSIAVNSLVGMVKTQVYLAAPGDDVSQAISRALAEVARELEGTEPGSPIPSV